MADRLRRLPLSEEGSQEWFFTGEMSGDRDGGIDRNIVQAPHWGTSGCGPGAPGCAVRSGA